MNIKTLQRLAAACVLGSLATSAIADALGEHPAVIVARTWNARGIDPNTFIVMHPAGTQLVAAPPAEKADQIATISESPSAQPPSRSHP